LSDVRDLVAAISFLTQVLVLGAVLLAVLASLAQRRWRIAVLRALRASRAYVFACLWLGVSLVLVAGSALGLLLGYLAALGLSRLFAERTALALPVTLSGAELLLLLGTVLVGLVLATVPAALGYRAPVAANLRG
jgi:putative ABC transport system permease protein